jgi:putative Mg2+ transporter-C (MgtC) family protein
MLTSLYVFDIYNNRVALDPARIAAGVITGIGFLGAGTIIRDREGVKGLTTAASLWVVAGIGLAVGCGFWRPAIYTTVLAFVVLFLLRYPERKMLCDKETKGVNKKGG